MPVEANRVANAARDDFGAAAVEIDASHLRMRVRRRAAVAGQTDRDIELVVRPDPYELPAVRFVLRQVVIDHRELWRIVEVVLDLLDLVDFGELGDVERAVLEGESVRPVQARRDHLDLTLAV